MAVLPEHRRRGIGRDLLRGIEEELKREGAETCYLEVQEDNSAARDLYRKSGYKEIERLKNYYRHSLNPNGIRLRKSLI